MNSKFDVMDSIEKNNTNDTMKKILLLVRWSSDFFDMIILQGAQKRILLKSRVQKQVFDPHVEKIWYDTCLRKRFEGLTFSEH